MNKTKAISGSAIPKEKKNVIIKRDIVRKKEPLNIVLCGHVDAGKLTIDGQLTISTRKGEFETSFERGGQICEHAMLVKTAGVCYLVVFINKMDNPIVNWEPSGYDVLKQRLFYAFANHFLKDKGCWCTRRSLYDNLTRKKTYDTNTLYVSELKRCLNVFDLTILGIGSTLGTGIYILTGQVAHETAGPSVVLSFLIAAIASVLAGLCYAEFGARAPRAGSAYTYTYVSVGEIMAFIIGWNMVLEYVIGTASTARALSAYFDSLINFTMKNFFKEHLPLHSGIFSEYADLFAMGLCLIITLLLTIGIKESALLNSVLTAVNLIVVTTVIIAGLTEVNGHNWNISPNEIGNITNSTMIIGKGGFFPFGIEGTLAGAATCFYAFVGFDLVATAGEETKNPQRAIPFSICLTLLVCSIVYCSVSIVITLMVRDLL
ncbi:unnamed protein product [Rotaria sp. Silwood2]|nr:unnamed protein product [Rotaria sp. Silwood2]CAF4145777.1 unnamed protein product [Rotaria sp. Silwood2]